MLIMFNYYFIYFYLYDAAVCSQPCLNGGECVRPGVCHCRKGYVGGSCESDLDECASDLHNCQPSAVCINMPGWYYCRCKPGYRSTILPDNTLSTVCTGKSSTFFSCVLKY